MNKKTCTHKYKNLGDIDTGHIETSEEMVQFKDFFNEWFLRDTSRKVRNGKRTRAKEGKVMTTYSTYRI